MRRMPQPGKPRLLWSKLLMVPGPFHLLNLTSRKIHSGAIPSLMPQRMLKMPNTRKSLPTRLLSKSKSRRTMPRKSPQELTSRRQRLMPISVTQTDRSQPTSTSLNGLNGFHMPTSWSPMYSTTKPLLLWPMLEVVISSKLSLFAHQLATAKSRRESLNLTRDWLKVLKPCLLKWA